MGIRILDELTVNKIAAGEVVENPAAVVKELVENAIDAGASAVTVEIEGGGIKKIRVTDNGSGISAEEVRLAFLRHATSKITDAGDLASIGSLGFRGEALASIAAVAHVHMATKQRSAEMGCEFDISGGREESFKAAGLPNGTTVVVGNLFYNTPARLKFLKNPAQETAAVTETISRLILSRPDVSFKYICNGETIYHSPGSGDIKDSMICVFGRETLAKTVPVDYTYENIHVYGYVGLPQFALAHRRSQAFIVNGRTVKAPNLSQYVRDAYSQLLLKGHHPFILLYLELSYGFTDVNVHPSKLAIRFRDEHKIEYIFKEAVNGALAQKPVTGHIRISAEPPRMPPELPKPEPPRIPAETPETGEVEDIREEKNISSYSISEMPEPARPETPLPAYDPLPGQSPKAPGLSWVQSDFFTPEAEGKPALHADGDTFYDTFTALQEKASAPPAPEPEKLDFGTPYKVLGQLFQSYILVECGERLLLIDQHAAHERNLFDKAAAAYRKGETLSMPLLLPEVVRVSPEEKALIDENIESFRALGFDIEEFGRLEYRIGAVPYIFERTDVEAMLDDMMGELRSGGSAEKPLLRAEKMIKAACKKAVKANQGLTDGEIEILVRECVVNAAMPTCPHGRPIVTVITKTEIEKGFKRIV